MNENSGKTVAPLRSFSRAPLVLAIVLLGFSLLHGLSYLRIVLNPHSYHEASAWIYDNIPRESSILGVHWDDKLPLHLPARSPHEWGYRMEGPEWELAIYEPDSPEKITKLCLQVSLADYIIFPTQRIPGSIPRIPDELPQSTAFLQLLFANQLGYELIASFKPQPGIGPFEINTDLGDESLSVYDHPKVTIFKNVERLPAAEIESRIRSPERFSPLLSRADILRRSYSRETAAGFDAPAWWLQLISWYVVLAFLSLVILPFTILALPDNHFAAASCAKVLSFIVPCGLAWWLHAAQITLGNGAAGWFSIAALSAAAAFFISRSTARFCGALSDWLRIEAAFLSCFCIFLIIRSYQPEIYWGEKPMDFSFLNYFMRSPDIPPDDPWAAGIKMHYYYLGFYLLAFLHLVTGADSALGYNFAVATVGALSLIAICGALYCFLHSRVAAMLGALAIGLSSNLEWLRLLIVKKEEIDFDFFWATSRLLSPPAITEYPLWSQLFADLHPHMIAQAPLIVGIACMALAWWEVSRGARPSSRPHLLAGISGVCWGMLLATNTWDFISLAAVTAIFSIAVVARRVMDQGFAAAAALLPSGARLIASFTVAGFIFSWPYWAWSGPKSEIHFGWVRDNEFNALDQIVRHLGVFLLPLALALLYFTLRRASRISHMDWTAGGALALLPFILAYASKLSGTVNFPVGILAFSSFLLLFGWLSLRASSSAEFILAAAAMALGCFISATELAFLIDRMNTIFKFYQSIWILAGIGAAASVMLLVQQAANQETPKMARVASISMLAFTTMVLCLGLIGSALNVTALLSFQRINGPRPTLNGMAFLPSRDGDEARLIDWMRHHIRGTPTILEAHGPSYQDYTRVTMHTGLPNVLGWDYHVQQRGTPRREIERRQAIITEIFSTAEASHAREMLCGLRVSYVFLGERERATYGEEKLRKFFQSPNDFLIIKQFGPTALAAPLCPARLQ